MRGLKPYSLNGFALAYSIFSSRKINYLDVRFLLLALLFYPLSLFHFSFLFSLAFLSERTCPTSLHIPDLMFCKVHVFLYSLQWYFKYCHGIISYLTCFNFSSMWSLPFKNIFLYLIFHFKYSKNNVLKCLNVSWNKSL